MKFKFKKFTLHYFLITLGVFITHWLSDITGTETWAINNGAIGWIGLFVFYMVFLMLFGFILKKIIGVKY